MTTDNPFKDSSTISPSNIINFKLILTLTLEHQIIQTFFATAYYHVRIHSEICNFSHYRNAFTYKIVAHPPLSRSTDKERVYKHPASFILSIRRFYYKKVCLSSFYNIFWTVRLFNLSSILLINPYNNVKNTKRTN